MAILDAATRLDNLTAPTSTGTVLGASYLDTLAIADYGTGADWLWWFQVSTAFTSNGASTLVLNLLGNATDVTFGSNNITLATSGTLALATLALGYQRSFKLQRAAPGANQSTNNYRYITVQAIVGAADFTAGAFSSWIAQDAMQDNRMYPAGYTVA